MTYLLSYGHLYVVALRICAFLLMEKKIKRSMQEIVAFAPFVGILYS